MVVAPYGTSRTVRDRVHDEVTREILRVARAHLTRDGAAALSLRSIARDLHMAPSALYRYFDGRDALLSALILAAYTSLAEAAETAAAAAARSGWDDIERWMAVPRAIRSWALTHPHEWGLVFGSPVPGYRAPEGTVAPYARVAAALVRPVREAHDGQRLNVKAGARKPSAAMAHALGPVGAALLPDSPTTTVLRVVQAWSTLVGTVSLEVFGHWRKAVIDPELVFDDTMRRAARAAGLRP